MRILRTSAPHTEHRQIAVIDATGRVAGFSGTKCLGVHALAEGEDAIAAGNLLTNPDVPAAMLAAFAATSAADLGERIVAAMRAGFAVGGEVGPVHSAGLLLADKVPWPVADLRVDWHDDPIGEIERVWALWQPQLDAYVTRALAPDAAPAHGVLGEV